ncbi:MAG: thioredoxin [Desulfovibrio sp.]|jgi:hypothetical protein|nr:thioredoxin [Desulfovibrio sp.]
MEYALIGLLALFLVFLFIEMKRKSERIKIAVADEKRKIADDSGMTASLGVFTPDTQTTVIIGSSEELGIFYYRMMRQARVIIRSRINMANLARIELLIDGTPTPVTIDSEQPTTSLKATDISEKTIGALSQDSLRQIQRAGLRVVFFDDAGMEKTLEITTLRSNDERHRFERVQLLKTTVWWVAFLQIASRLARHVRARMESDEIGEPD